MSSSVGSDPQQLLHAVWDGNMRRVKTVLKAGANVDGCPRYACAPIVAATMAGHADIVECLLEQGADPDRPVTQKVPCIRLDLATIMPGERALHLAAKRGKLGIVRLLLKRGRADPNVTDSRGRTPLLLACECPNAYCVEVVSLLLEAGADPIFADERGYTPLHAVAEYSNGMDLADMLCTRAPAALDICCSKDDTPLFVACARGHEGMVSKLLSLGSRQCVPHDKVKKFPLGMAAYLGFVGVVRVLINEGGMVDEEGIGTVAAKIRIVIEALVMAIRYRQAGTLRLLLTVDGEERRSEWANMIVNGTSHLLHGGATYSFPAGVSVLLRAGADEAACDSFGNLPRDVIGEGLGQDGMPKINPGEDVAIRRMLQRGPAYRARSWAWPSGKEAGAGGSGDGEGAAAAVLSSPPAVPKSPVICVRMFRPKEKSSRMFFGRLIGRYCAKA